MVATATEAVDGLAKLADGRVHCLVSDDDKPRMDGLELLETVREERPDLPVIRYTGTGSEAIAGEATSAGVTDYLQKSSGAHQSTVQANLIRQCLDQYRAEQAIKATRERFSKLLEESADVIFIVDRGGTVRYTTPSVERVLAYTPDELLDPDAFEVEYPDDGRPGTGERGVRGGVRGATRRRDGRVPSPARERVVAVARSPRSEPPRRSGDRRDRREHPRYHRAQGARGTVPDAVRPVGRRDLPSRRRRGDPRGNRKASELLGDDYDELVGTTIWEIAADPDEASVRARWREIAPDGTATFEGCHERADGSTVPVEVNVATVDLDETVQYIATVRDVTERRERERHLREERDRRAALFENASSPMVELRFDDGTPIIEAVNPSFEAVFGYDPETVIDQTIWDVPVPDDRLGCHEDKRRRVFEGALIEVEVERKTATGVLDFLLLVTPVTIDGRLDGAYGWFSPDTGGTEHGGPSGRREPALPND